MTDSAAVTRWACRRNGCSAGGEAPTALEAVADQWAHFCAEHRQGGGGSVRVVDAPASVPRGDHPRIESARLLGDPALAVILEPGRLVNPGAGRPLELSRPAHLGALADVVTEHVGALFITAAGADWLGLPARPDDDQAHPFLDDAIAAGWVVDPPALNWQVRIRRSAESRALPVVFCPYDVDGYALPWSGLAGDELEAGLAAFRTAVGVCAGPSLGSTAERILLATHNVKKGGARLDRTPSLPPAVFELAEIGTTWRRALDDERDAGGWVHWFDANANYLGAYQTAELGRGEADVWPLGEAREAVRDARYLPPALWCADLPALPDTLPAPWSTSARWHTSPTIARARELLGAAELERSITAAMRWPLKSRFCEPFGGLMRDARRRLLEAPDTPGSAAALAAVTGCYQRLHGRFGAGFRQGTRSPWFRPDWMHTIRAQARVNLDRRIRSLAAPPFAVDVDALYFVADDPDPEIVAGRLGLPLGPRAKLGAFRPAGSVALSDQLRAALGEVGTAAGTRELLRAAVEGVVPVSGAAMLDAIAPALLEDDAGDEDDLAELVDALRGE